IVNLAALAPLVLHGHCHGNGFSSWVRSEPLNLRCLALGMGHDQDARNSLDGLERQGTLLFKLLASPLSPLHQFIMACLGLGEPTLGTLFTSFNSFLRPADFLVHLVEQLC